LLRVQDQIVQARRGAADREQVHRSPPQATRTGISTACGFSDLPM
jgi:hypothetical protein